MEYISSLTVNLKDIAYNLNQIKDSLPKNTLICPVVKDDCYQMGAKKIVELMMKMGIDIFAVANIDEAFELRELSKDIDILILGHILPSDFKYAIKNNIILTVSTIAEANLLDNAAKSLEENARVHIKIDTGMNRIGFKALELGGEDFTKLFSYSNLRIEGIFSHFATADNDTYYADYQMKNFRAAIKRIPDEYENILKHINNSASLICGYPECYDLVRPGIIIYGVDVSQINDRAHLKLREAFSLKSKLMHIKRVLKGESIGYSCTFKAERDMIVGTVGIGYGDGYPRRLSNNFYVLINGQRANIVGNICMDQIMIDLTDIANYKLYDDVVLIGKSGDDYISINDMADRINDIPYTIMCGINKRVKRIYIE